MSQLDPENFVGLHLVGLHQLSRSWGRVLGLGVLLIVLGALAVSYSVIATLATVVFFGWLMIAGGTLQTLSAFSFRHAPGFFMDLLSGILSVVVGLLIVMHPGPAAGGITLLIAGFLIIGGIFRLAVASAVRFQNWFWLLLHGGINVLLGVMILRQWPSDALWVIGLFIGIDLLFNGWSLVMLGVALKQLPKRGT